MIPAIALMVGAYIITRMISLLADKKETGILTTIFSAITIFITLYCIYTVLKSGAEISKFFPY